MEEEEKSTLTTLQKKVDDRSDFDRAFEDDSLHQLQDRMVAKAKTKKLTAEDFVKKAKKELAEDTLIVEELAPTEETPEPEEEPPPMFTFTI